MAVLWIALAFLAGCVLSVQAGVNVIVARGTGGAVWGALISFLVGTIGLLILLAATRAPAPRWTTMAAVPPWAWFGGLLGAIYVIGVVAISPRLGLAATMALIVAGQTGSAMLLDHFGALGFATHPVNPMRLLGAALLVGGVALIRFF